jgi:hypothetical protein
VDILLNIDFKCKFASDVEGAAQVGTPGDDKIKLVPVARPRVSPRDFVAIFFVPIFTLEVSIGHIQITVAAQFQQSLSVLVHFACTMVSKTGRPAVAVGSHSSIEVS